MRGIIKVATLLASEDYEEEKEPTIKHSRKHSKTTLEQKTFNMGQLSTRKNSEEFPRRREFPEYNSKVVPYKKAIHFVRLNPDFMTKEELMQVKVFPMREWLVIKAKAPRFANDSQHISNNNRRGFKVIVVLIMGLVVSAVIGIIIILSVK